MSAVTWNASDKEAKQRRDYLGRVSEVDPTQGMAATHPPIPAGIAHAIGAE
jgi:hypothetical protein